MSLLTGFEEIIRQSEPLAGRTWFNIGGTAEYYAEPRSPDELQALVKRASDEKVPIHMLGGGSNLLIRDDGVHGLVLHLTGEPFSKIEVNQGTVLAGGGAKLGHVVSTSIREGLGGFEALVGIPGSVGGALHGNSGGRGGDIGQWTTRAVVMTRAGEIIERDRSQLVFAYRQSSLDELAILEASFALEPDDPEQLTRRMQQQWIIKKASQPLSHESAGCVFKNPRGMSAGMLIDQAGLKGTRVGGAEVSARHANFIVADSGSSSSDVLRLIDLVKGRVEERLGVELETEIEIW